MQRASVPKHKLSVHEGVKSLCDQCGYEATTRSHITEHKRHSMMGCYLIVTSSIISHLGGVCLLGTLRLYIIDSNIIVNSVTIQPFKRGFLIDINNMNMRR